MPPTYTNAAPHPITNAERRTMIGNAGEPFPQSRIMIADAIEEAIFDAFGMEPPLTNSRPIRDSAGKEKS